MESYWWLQSRIEAPSHATASFSNQIAEQLLLINLVIDGKITPKSESIDTLHTITGEIKSAPETILLVSSLYYFQLKHG